jgi:LemA protein
LPLHLILALAAAAALLGLVFLYNGLVGRRQLVNNGWSDIDVQLKRRADLVPRLVSTVEGYAAHERNLFAEIAEKRAAAQAAGDDPARRAAAENALAGPVSKLVALGEAYPDLKANQNFLELQKELSDTETKLEMARRFYKGAARELNILVESFPSNLVAGLFGFSQRPFFEIETAAERAAPQIKLDRPA